MKKLNTLIGLSIIAISASAIAATAPTPVSINLINQSGFQLSQTSQTGTTGTATTINKQTPNQVSSGLVYASSNPQDQSGTDYSLKTKGPDGRIYTAGGLSTISTGKDANGKYDVALILYERQTHTQIKTTSPYCTQSAGDHDVINCAIPSGTQVNVTLSNYNH